MTVYYFMFFNVFFNLLSVLTSGTYTRYDNVSCNLPLPFKGNHQNHCLYFDYIKKNVVLCTNKNDDIILLYHIT